VYQASKTVVINDTRTENPSPGNHMSNFASRMIADFKIGAPDDSDFSSVLSVVPWSDPSGGYPAQLSFTMGGKLFYRIGSDQLTWGPWHQIPFSDGTVSNALRATGDAAGNNIQTTYATKKELPTVPSKVSAFTNDSGYAKAADLATVAKSGSYKDLLNQPAIPSKTSQLTNDSRYVSTDASGNVVLTGTLTATQVFNAVYNDYAEFFPRGGETERGDIIACDEISTREQYVKATDKSRCVVGVHSEEFTQIIGGLQVEDGKGVMETNIRQFIPVAMAGRVHVKYFGKAVVGTKVVPSEIPGVGRAWQEGDSLDHVVGRIVEPDTRQDVRLVKILVGG